MDGSSPPSFTASIHAETSYPQVNDQYHAADTGGPQSFSAMNIGRPVSGTQDQPHLKAVDGDPNLKRQPTFKDVAPVLGQSSVDYGYAGRGPDAVNQEERPKTIGDLAAANKHHSGTVGTPAYDEDKIPSHGDMRQPNHSSGNQQGGYQYTPGPKSYNGDNFGRFTW